MTFHISIYRPLLWPEKTLPYLHERLMAEKDPAFWCGNQPFTREDFIRYFTDPGLVLALPILTSPDHHTTFEDILGMIWVDQVVTGHRARGHLYFFENVRRRRGINLREITTRGLEMLHTSALGINHVYFLVTPQNRLLRNFAEKLGLKWTGTIPGYFRRNGDDPGDAWIAYKDLRSLDHGEHHGR